MLDEPKIISSSRIPQVTNTSREFIDRLLQHLEEQGLIEPERTPTGRRFLSVSEWATIKERLGA